MRSCTGMSHSNPLFISSIIFLSTKILRSVHFFPKQYNKLLDANFKSSLLLTISKNTDCKNRKRLFHNQPFPPIISWTPIHQIPHRLCFLNKPYSATDVTSPPVFSYYDARKLLFSHDWTSYFEEKESLAAVRFQVSHLSSIVTGEINLLQCVKDDVTSNFRVIEDKLEQRAFLTPHQDAPHMHLDRQAKEVFLKKR